MSIEDYFSDWIRFIDTKELSRILRYLNTVSIRVCPSLKNIFRAFELCTYNNCKIVFIGQDPYPQKGVATGLLFGNSKETTEDLLSPSLKVIKNSVINFAVPHNFINFDPTLESWAKQGILLLNSALTCEVNRIGSHTMLWRGFMSTFLSRLSNSNIGLLYVLFGKQAQTFKPYINSTYNTIVEAEHPAYYARKGKEMPRDIFNVIDKFIKDTYNLEINWYYEEN